MFNFNFQNVLDLCADPFEYDAFVYNGDARQKTCYACSTGHEYEGAIFNFGEMLSEPELKRCNFSFAELNYSDYICEPDAAFGGKSPFPRGML